MDYLTRNHSTEYQADSAIEDLIGKIVEGSITDKERLQLAQQIAERTRLMLRDVPIKSGYTRRAA